MKKTKTENFTLPTSAASRHTTPLRGYFLSSRFICEATNHSSSRFCYEATGMIEGRFPLLWNLSCLLFLHKAVNKSSTPIEVFERALRYRKTICCRLRKL